MHTPVCVTNLVQYVELVKDFWLDTGIRAQAEAFRAGVRDFFPAEALLPFSCFELQRLVSESESETGR